MDGDEVNFNAGVDLTVENMLPVYTMEEGITKDIEVYKTAYYFSNNFLLCLFLIFTSIH